MFVYRLPEPIDLFDGLTPLHDWVGGQHPSRAAFALRAVLALADAAEQVGWRGDMRHLPMVGGLPTPGRAMPYLAVKQHNNGDTFLISPVPIPGIDEDALTTETVGRDIGDWAPEENDIPDPAAF